MIDIVNGKIILCRSGFSLSPSLKPAELEKNIARQILSQYRTDTDYMHYTIGCDINAGEYVYTDICFFEETLRCIKFFPQHKSHDLSTLKTTNMDLDSARELAFRWFEANFPQQTVWQWGTVRFCPVSDPIYSPPNILLQYV